LDIVLAVVVVALVTAGVAISYQRWSEERRIERFNGQLLEALEMLSRALRAGHSVAAGIHNVATNRQGPVAREFQQTWADQNAGRSLTEALAASCGRVPSLELRLFAIAVGINEESGGNLADVLDRLAVTMRARRQLKEDVRTLTAQGRYGAWFAGALPFVMALAITWISPDHLEPLYKTQTGRIMAFIAIAMITVGTLTIRWLANFKV
jgi:tight adherence protein B